MKEFYNKLVDFGYKLACKKTPNEYSSLIKLDNDYIKAVDSHKELIEEFTQNVRDVFSSKSDNYYNLTNEQERSLDNEYFEIIKNSRTLMNIVESEKEKELSNLKKDTSFYALNPLIGLNPISRVVNPFNISRKGEIVKSFNNAISNNHRRVKMVNYQTFLIKNDIQNVKNKYGIAIPK